MPGEAALVEAAQVRRASATFDWAVVDFYGSGLLVDYTRYFEAFTGSSAWDGLMSIYNHMASIVSRLESAVRFWHQRAPFIFGGNFDPDTYVVTQLVPYLRSLSHIYPEECPVFLFNTYATIAERHFSTFDAVVRSALLGGNVRLLSFRSWLRERELLGDPSTWSARYFIHTCLTWLAEAVITDLRGVARSYNVTELYVLAAVEGPASRQLPVPPVYD